MENKTTFRLDDVTIQRAADGMVIITPRRGRGCLSIGLLVGCVVAALLCGGGLVVNGVMQLFSSEGENPIGFILFGLFILAMFGSMAFLLFTRVKDAQNQKQVTISPIMNTITIGERVIPFSEVENIIRASGKTGVIKMEGVRISRFMLTMRNGEVIELGSLAIDNTRKDDGSDEIIYVLKKALRKV